MLMPSIFGENLFDDFFDYHSLIKQVNFDKKEYLKNSFRNYDKDFLLKKYYLKSNGEEIENNIKELAEETNERILKKSIYKTISRFLFSYMVNY